MKSSSCFHINGYCSCSSIRCYILENDNKSSDKFWLVSSIYTDNFTFFGVCLDNKINNAQEMEYF